MTTVNMFWGPDSYRVYPVTGSLSTTNFTDLDNSVAWSFAVPWDGTITHVGLYIGTRGGNPPPYKVGIATLDTNGRPDIYSYGTTYPDVNTVEYSFPAIGWYWVPLTVAATAYTGQYAAARIWPGTTTPTISNYVGLARTPLGGFGTTLYYSTSWTAAAGNSMMAIKYSDGRIYGNAFSSATAFIKIAEAGDDIVVGNRFTLPSRMRVDGIRIPINTSGIGAGATIAATLYGGVSDKNVLAFTAVQDKDFVDENSDQIFWFDEVELLAEQEYRVTFSLTGTTSATTSFYLPLFRFESAAARSAWPCGDRWNYTTIPRGAHAEYPWWNESLWLMPMSLHVTDMVLHGGYVNNTIEYAFVA